MSLCSFGTGSTFRSDDSDRFPRGDANVFITGQLPRIAPEVFPARPRPDPSDEPHASVVSLSTLEAVTMASGVRLDSTSLDFCVYGAAMGLPYLRALIEKAELDPSILALADGVGCPALVYTLRHLARVTPPLTLRDCMKTEQGHARDGQTAIPGDAYTGGDRGEADSDDEPGTDHSPLGRLRANVGDVTISSAGGEAPSGGSGGGASSGSAVGGGKGGGSPLVIGGKGAVSLDPGRPPTCKPRKVLERPIPKAGAAASFDSTASHYILVLSSGRVLFHRAMFDTLLLRFGTAALPLTAGSFLVSPLLAPVGNQQAARTFLSNTHVDFVLPHNDWFSKVLVRSCIDVSASGGSANLPPYFQ
jgi:hypothetical protein